MKHLLFIYSLMILASSFSCKKKPEGPPFPDYGCVTGMNRNTGGFEYVGCWNLEVYMAGNDQAAADRIADEKGIPRVDVTVRDKYNMIMFKSNDKCDCR